MPYIWCIILKETPQKIELEGEVLDTEQRKVRRIGTSFHVSIPQNRVEPGWKKFFTSPVLEIDLVRVPGDVIAIIRRPKKKGSEP